MGRPAVINWFMTYAILMVVIYILVIGFGIFLAMNPDFFVDPDARMTSNVPTSNVEAVVMGVIYAGIGVVLAAAFIVSLFTPQRFWAWIYNLVMICIGLTSCCFWPICIPLLIFWVKQDVRDWYRNERPTTIQAGPTDSTGRPRY